MGKKSKTKKGGGGGGRASSSTSSSSTPWVAPDGAGRMEERHGRRLYGLLDALSLVVIPRVNAVLPPQQRIDWNPLGSAYNSIPTRTVVYDYLLENLEQVVTETKNGMHEGIFRTILGRRLMQQDWKDVEGLKCHIEDDFFIMKHLPNPGTVFCQVGNIHKRNDGRLDYEEDKHEVRLFMVQGLAEPLQNICDVAVQVFAQENPRLAEKYGQKFPDLCEMHTTLIPYNECITYMSVMNHPTLHHHNTPQETSAAVRAAVEACRAALAENPGPDAPKLHRSLDPQTDMHLCRLGTSPGNMMTRGIKHAMAADAERPHDDTFEIPVLQMAWSPFNIAGAQQVYDDVVNNVRPRPPHEGVKNEVGVGVVCKNDDLCPFHRSLGEGRKFADCCLESYRQRSRKGPPSLTFDPLENDEADRVFEFQASLGRDITMSDLTRLGYMVFSDSTFQIDPSKTAELKKCMDEFPLFHNVLGQKWVFLGQHKIRYMNQGVYTFGDVEIIPDIGQVILSTSTQGRLKTLSTIMKNILGMLGIDVVSVDIKITPVPGNTPDSSLVDAMRKTLVEGLGNIRESEVSTNIDKNAFRGKRCGYCGLDDEDKLERCACKKVW